MYKYINFYKVSHLKEFPFQQKYFYLLPKVFYSVFVKELPGPILFKIFSATFINTFKVPLLCLSALLLGG